MGSLSGCILLEGGAVPRLIQFETCGAHPGIGTRLGWACFRFLDCALSSRKDSQNFASAAHRKMGFEGRWHPGPWMVSGPWGLDPVLSPSKALTRGSYVPTLHRASGLEEDG